MLKENRDALQILRGELEYVEEVRERLPKAQPVPNNR